MAQTDSATISQKERRMWGLGLEGWNNVIVLFLSLGAAAAVIVGVATYVAFQLQKQEALDAREELTRYKIGVAAEIATANKDAADARLETERLKAQVAWRTVTPEGAAKLEELLAAKPGSVNIEYVAGDPEATTLAIELAKVFEKAKWKFAMLGQSFSGTVVFGIFVPDSPSGDTATIRAALNEVKAGFSSAVLPTPLLGLGGSIPNAATLFVGSKPHPDLHP